jgi:ribosomal protein L12E/L44/L45/RPP1/RPP2
MEQEITAETVKGLAQAVGLTLPDEDIEPVVAALRGYRAAFRPLEDLDLTEVDPVVVTDPRWA